MELLHDILIILLMIMIIAFWIFITISTIKDVRMQKELNEKMIKSIDLQIEQITKEIKNQEQLTVEIEKAKKSNKKVGRPKKEGK